MLKKLWKWYTKFCGKLINVDYDAEITDLKERWKGMRKSPKEFEEIPKRWKRFKKEPIKYIKTTGKEIFAANLRHAYKLYKFFKKF